MNIRGEIGLYENLTLFEIIPFWFSMKKLIITSIFRMLALH